LFSWRLTLTDRKCDCPTTTRARGGSIIRHYKHPSYTEEHLSPQLRGASFTSSAYEVEHEDASHYEAALHIHYIGRRRVFHLCLSKEGLPS